MIVISDSSPLITLAKIDCFSLLEKLYGQVVISSEVYAEVVVAGTGLAGVADISKSPWIEVRRIKNPADLIQAKLRFGLGMGELSTMILAKEIKADLIILDDLGARKIAQKEGFKIVGTLAVLKACYRKDYLSNLREAYVLLLKHGVYMGVDLLNASLKSFSLPGI